MSEPDERAYVSPLWAEDWDSPEDAIYDEPPVLPDWDRIKNARAARAIENDDLAGWYEQQNDERSL